MTKRVLVVDSAYLVAMDIERVLAHAFGWEVQLGTPLTFSQDMSGEPFQLVILEAEGFKARLSETVEQVRSKGATLLFSTTDAAYAGGIPNFTGHPVLVKPFDDQNLIAAVRELSVDRPSA